MDVVDGLTTHLMVAGIDLGNEFSRIGSSFRSDFQERPLEVRLSTWASGISSKTPTSILFDGQRRFHSFGFEAEEKYCELSYNGEHKDWYYFPRFKMMLYSASDIQRTTILLDETGKEMPAIVVFTEAIKYLRDNLLERCKYLDIGLEKEDFGWVITVPAIWSDGGKQFMREAAERAGIKRDHLSLAFEPEAVVMFYKYLSVTLKDKITCFQPHSKYLILNAGGDSINFTAHEVQHNGTLHELFKANVEPWGGTMVDKEFLLLIEKITGKEVMEKFQQQSKKHIHIDFIRNFEVTKYSVAPSQERKTSFELDKCSNEFSAAIQDNPEFAGKITIVSDKLRVCPEIMKSLFKNTCEKIVHHLNDILSDPRAEGTDTILMVGKFSESPMLQDAIEKAFRHMRVICPPEPQFAMLNGAVIFGHDSNRITQRISKYAYEIQTSGNVDPTCHLKKGFKDRTLHVRGTFHKLVKVGQPISEGKSRKQRRL